MKLLQTSNSNQYAVVDDEDFDRLNKFNWQWDGHTIRRTVYDAEMYNLFNIHSKTIPIANEIMRRYFCVFDHMDRDPKNNQKSNLRECSHQQNMFNKEKNLSIKTTSKYKGVYRNSKNTKWISQIKKDRKTKYIGCFDTQEEAAIAYNGKASLLFGEFAVLNKVESANVIEQIPQSN